MTSINKDDIASWLDDYKKAWETQDSGLIVSIFSADAVYQVDPFVESHHGADAIKTYWQENPLQQKNITFAYTVLGAQDNYGMAHWTAEFDKGEKHVALNGIFKLTFNDDKKCTHLQEWWHKQHSPLSTKDNA